MRSKWRLCFASFMIGWTTGWLFLAPIIGAQRHAAHTILDMHKQQIDELERRMGGLKDEQW